MDTQNLPLLPANDTRPQDQQERAAKANLNPNDPTVGTDSPNYGEFGGVPASPPTPVTYASPTTTAPGRSGANDNPDEFSELQRREKDAQKAPDNAKDQPGHIEQNQDPAAVRAAQHADTDEQRAAWSKDDPRYAGGGTHNTREEPAGNPATEK